MNNINTKAKAKNWLKKLFPKLNLIEKCILSKHYQLYLEKYYFVSMDFLIILW